MTTSIQALGSCSLWSAQVACETPDPSLAVLDNAYPVPTTGQSNNRLQGLVVGDRVRGADCAAKLRGRTRDPSAGLRLPSARTQLDRHRRSRQLDSSPCAPRVSWRSHEVTGFISWSADEPSMETAHMAARSRRTMQASSRSASFPGDSRACSTTPQLRHEAGPRRPAVSSQ